MHLNIWPNDPYFLHTDSACLYDTYILMYTLMVETPQLHLQSIIVEVGHVRQASVVGPVFVQSKEKVHYIACLIFLWVCDLKVEMMFNSFIFHRRRLWFLRKRNNTVVFSIQMTYFLCSINRAFYWEINDNIMSEKYTFKRPEGHKSY